MDIDIRALVSAALRSVPAGIAARVTVTRTVPGTVDRATGLRTGDTSLVMADLACFVIPARKDRTLPPGLVREHAREVIIAGADCTTFVPNTDDTVQIGAAATRVIEGDPLDLGVAEQPVVVTLLVKW